MRTQQRPLLLPYAGRFTKVMRPLMYETRSGRSLLLVICLPCGQLIEQVTIGVSIVGQNGSGCICERLQIRIVDLHACILQRRYQVIGLLLVVLTVRLCGSSCCILNDLLLIGYLYEDFRRNKERLSDPEEWESQVDSAMVKHMPE